MDSGSGKSARFMSSASPSNASTQFFQRLHAIDLTTGAERIAPHSIDSYISVPGTGAGSVAGQVAFDPRNESQAPAWFFPVPWSTSLGLPTKTTIRTTAG